MLKYLTLSGTVFAHFLVKQKTENMGKQLLLITGILFIALFSNLSCRKDKNNNNSYKAQVSMRLTDAPGDYDAVYIDIQAIEVKMASGTTVNIAPYRVGIYNILTLRNGIDTLLVNTSLPVGTIEQVRLILGNNNSVVVDGVSHQMDAPSASQSGIKLNLHTTLEADRSYTVWIDFDAGKSIVVTGSGKYMLKPTMRAYTALTNGRIEGYVLPLAAFATVYAVHDGDTAAAIPSGIDGHFVISGLEEGSYQIIVEPAIPTYVTFNSTIVVSHGTVTSVGTITLLP